MQQVADALTANGLMNKRDDRQRSLLHPLNVSPNGNFLLNPDGCADVR